jgi:hypothetical protein
MPLKFASFLLLIALISGCQRDKDYIVKSYDIQGAFFGVNQDEQVLLTNATGSLKQEATLKANGAFSFNVTEADTKAGPLYLIYTYEVKPTLNPKPPYIKALIGTPKHNLFLPAILVFPLKFTFLPKENPDTLSFSWSETAFSQGGKAKFNLMLAYKEGLLFKKQHLVKTKTFDFNRSEGTIDLSKHFLPGKVQLKDKLEKLCNSDWFLELPYHYPEGLDLVYTSNPETVTFCDSKK